ncbi:ROK family protein [candidate division KSB1 bacterium]|nr:ROK family protein [candidate division KSB1 bacterium]
MNENPGLKLRRTPNEIRLLNLIREEGPISRNEIAKRIQISKVAAWEIIGRLIETGFIIEIGKGQSTTRGGKKPNLLELNPDNGYVVGVEIRRDHSTIAIANIVSEIKKIEVIPHQIGAKIDEVIQNLFHKIDQLLIDSRIGIGQLISFGIGIPGFVNYEKGELAFADTLQGWANLPLVTRFQERFGVPVFIENDVNAITLGESLLGAGQSYGNVVCIWIGEGIGSGVLLNGQMVRGENGTAGELGYLNLNNFFINERKLDYLHSNQKFLGDILSEQNLLNVLKQNLQRNHADSIEEVQLNALFELVEKGNPIVRSILDEYAFLLANLCLMLVKTINPGLIILSGHVIEYSEYILNGVRHLIQNGMLNIPFKPAKIVAGELKDQAGVKGTISLALQAIFGSTVIINKYSLRSLEKREVILI